MQFLFQLLQWGLLHKCYPTHGDPVSGILLDLVLLLLSDVSIQSVCFSDDHCLVKCRLGMPPTQLVTTTYSYQPLCKLDTVAFSRDILSSRLYDFTVADVDVCLTMKFNAYWTSTRHCTPAVDTVVRTTLASSLIRHNKPSSCMTAIDALVWRRALCMSACSAACKSIIKSHADHIKSSFNDVACDIGATWHTAQCTNFVSTFSGFSLRRSIAFACNQ